MTVYTAIPNGDIDQDSPITQPLLTALRDNLIACAEGDASVPTGARFGHVLLGSIATTSGTAQTLSSLTLTGYRKLVLEVNGVTVSSVASSPALKLDSTTGATLHGGTWSSGGSTPLYGLVEISLLYGTYIANLAFSTSTTATFTAFASVAPTGMGPVYGRCALTNSSTSVTLALSANNFTGGTILVYGVR